MQAWKPSSQPHALIRFWNVVITYPLSNSLPFFRTVYHRMEQLEEREGSEEENWHLLGTYFMPGIGLIQLRRLCTLWIMVSVRVCACVRVHVHMCMHSCTC